MYSRDMWLDSHGSGQSAAKGYEKKLLSSCLNCNFKLKKYSSAYELLREEERN